MTPTEAWIVVEFANNGSLLDFTLKLYESTVTRMTPVYGAYFPQPVDDSDDDLIKIIRNIMMGILEDIASGIAYIHKQFWFHNFKMVDIWAKAADDFFVISNI